MSFPSGGEEIVRVSLTRGLWRSRIALTALGVLLSFVGSVGIASAPASATSFSPGEGNGAQWCARYGGTSLASFDNVFACSTKSVHAGATPFNPSVGGFQCTELADRFLWAHWQRQPIFSPTLDGASFASTVHSMYRSVPLVQNGTVGQPYEPGDIVSFSGKPGKNEPDGHVAIVVGSNENSEGDGTVTILEQNSPTGPQGEETLHVTNWTLETPASSWVTPTNFDALATAPSAAPSSQPPSHSSSSGAPHASTQKRPPIQNGLAVGEAFDDYCVVAWPTAPTITTNAIIMTMSCEHVPENKYLFTQVRYGNPHLNMTPDTGTVRVVGKIVDVATSDYGYKELIVQASKVVLPS